MFFKNVFFASDGTYSSRFTFEIFCFLDWSVTMNHSGSIKLLKRKGILAKRLESVLRTFVLLGVFAGISAPAWADVVVDLPNGTISGDGEYAGAIVLAANATVTPTAGSTITLNGAVSGEGYGLTQGSDNLTLAGGYSCSGVTTINGGTLTIKKLAGSGNWYLYSSEFNINNGSTLQFVKDAGAGDQNWFRATDENKFTFSENGGGTLDTGTGLNMVLDRPTTFTTNGGAKNQITGASGFNMQTTGAIKFDVAKGTDANGEDLVVSTYLWNGNGSVTKTGAGTLVMSGGNTYTKGTTISEGTLKITGTVKTSGFAIAEKATLVIDTTTASRDFGANQTFTGSGTFIKIGANNLGWGQAVATFAMDAGAEIRVEGGTFIGGSWGNENWTNNKSSLYVANGATFAGVEANVRVDALNGDGTISTGYNGSGYQNFTFGVANGSGEFSGTLANGSATGNFVKVGTGTQILSGNNTYTGTTTISGGILIAGSATALGNSSSLTVAQGASFVPYEKMTFTGKYTTAGTQNVVLTVTESPAFDLSVNTLLTGGNLTLGDTFAFDITSTPGLETLFANWEIVSNFLKDNDVSLLELSSEVANPEAMRDTISVLTDRNLFDPASGAYFYAQWNADGGAGKFGAYDLQVGVPEPSSWALLVLGAFGILGLRHRKR